MKRIFWLILASVLIIGCVQEHEELKPEESPSTGGITFDDLLSDTKAGNITSTLDSLNLQSKLQSSKDNLMLGRIILADGVYTRLISKEDALFFGISEETYERYVAYTEELNEIKRHENE